MEIQVGIGLGGGPVASPGVTIRIWRNRFRHLNFNLDGFRTIEYHCIRQLDQTQGIPISISGCADNIADAQGSNDIDGPAGDLHRRSGIANPGCPHRIPGVAGNTADRCHRAAHDRDFPAGTPAPPPMPASLFPPRALRDPVLSDEMTIAAPTGISNPAHISPLPRVLLPTNVNST